MTAELHRLLSLRGRLAESDALARRHAEATLGAELTKSGQLVHRYEREAFSRFMRLRRELAGPAAPVASLPSPARITTPAPPAAPARVEPVPPRSAVPAPEPEDEESLRVLFEQFHAVMAEKDRLAAEAPKPTAESPSRPPHPGLNRQQRRALARQGR